MRLLIVIAIKILMNDAACTALPHPLYWCSSPKRDALAAKCASLPLYSNPIRHWKVL